MERPWKRQKLSQDPVLAIPSRTIDLQSFQRPQNRRRGGGKVVLPRVPDVTVTAAVLEVAVNDGSTTTQIAVPTTDIAVTLSDLGTVTIPAISSETASGLTASGTSTSSSGSSSNSQSEPISGSTSTKFPVITSTNHNSTRFSTASGNTITVTATSTFHISYDNGLFLPVTATRKSGTTDTAAGEDLSTNIGTDDQNDFASTSTTRYNFNQGTSQTTNLNAASTNSGAGSYNGYNGDTIAGATGSGVGTASQPTSSTSTDSGTSPPILSPQQTRMVGGIVGGIAGIAMILMVLLYLLRWYRERLKKQGRLPRQLVSSRNSRDFGVSGLVGCAAPMSQSRTALFPIAAGTCTKKWRPDSDMTTITNATSMSGSDSERGFHRVSGRKIPSVLSTGGDQFGGSYGAFEKESATMFRSTNTASHYSDGESAHGYTSPHRPPSRSAPSTPIYPGVFASEATALRSLSASSPRGRGFDDFQNAFGRNISKPDGIAVFHNSPARTPVMQSPNTGTLRFPIQAPVTMDRDIPEMPLPSPGLNYHGMYNIGLAIGNATGERRIPSGRLSARSGTSNGRFKEELE